MRGYQHVLFRIVPAGQNLIGEIMLHESTWQNHILVRHPELSGKLADVERVMTCPSNIFATSSGAGSYLFVKARIVDSSGRLLRVVVGIGNSVKTAYFSSA